jgi:hypothetical protein
MNVTAGDRLTTKESLADKRIRKRTDDSRRPVWLEATESFYKKLNRIANECDMSRYEALSRGLDALLRETQIRNPSLNKNIKTQGNQKCSAGLWGKSRGIIGRRSARKRNASGPGRVRRRAGANILEAGV